ncbi:hypothetical protein [Streptomyces geranii]|uniref:hypothetical protein n=1 Tax=Streptomyces geranii TaxID=2058923 RepID=UPI00130022EF|nr:hypothetical protein [Streptomyces geranii]
MTESPPGYRYEGAGAAGLLVRRIEEERYYRTLPDHPWPKPDEPRADNSKKTGRTSPPGHHAHLRRPEPLRQPTEGPKSEDTVLLNRMQITRP